jgi:serine phosphatase RsbU (regulator of sigma subunit)
MPEPTPQKSETLLPKDPDSVSKAENLIDSLLKRALEIRIKDIELAIRWTNEALKIAEDLGDGERSARAKNYLGLFFMITGKNGEAIDYAEQAVTFFRNAGPNNEGEAFGLYTLGSVHYKTAHHEKGLALLFQSLEIYQVLGDKANESRTLKAIGYIYEIFDDYDNAIKNYLKCVEISNEIGDKNGESNACNPLSGIYLKQDNLEKADELIERSIRLKRETGDVRGIAFAYYGKGKVLFAQKKYQEAEEYINQSLHLHIEMGDPLGEGLAKQKLGKVFLASGDLEKAEEQTKMALEIGEKIKNNDIIYDALFQLYLIAKNRNQIALSLKYFEQYHRVKETVLNMESSGKIKAREAIHNAELSGKETEIERLKNIELKKAHDEIATQNREIMHSIKYARRIQQAILPSAQRWKSEFPNSFSIFIPRDIVSGDFYWLKKKGQKVLFSVVDCTGHGVPGAMLSMVGYNGLNQLVDRLNITKPSYLLDNLCGFMSLAFRSDEHDIKDGMDMAMCCYNKENFTLEYAGANNPLYLIRKGELIEYKANKQPIGNYSELSSFDNHVITLEDRDRVYLLSDGYADQFGGPNLRKFKSGTLKKLLIDIQDQPMEKQQQILSGRFEEWRGDYFQVDDVCLIGIEFSRN